MNLVFRVAARRALCLGVGLLLLAASADGRERFAARLADGTAVVGDQLTDWHSVETMPRLNGHALFAQQNSALWLRDRSLRPGEFPTAYVEMVGGDRLPGQVLSFAGGASLGDAEPACLLIEPAIEIDKPGTSHRGTLAVIERFVRRIVWKSDETEPIDYQPGTIVYRDGRTLRYRAIRFGEQQVSLLTETGQVTSLFGEIAELHLPARDPWETYCSELAILCPERQGRLMQVETTTGLIVTASIERMDATVYGNSRDSDRWWHGLQPAWALRPLWAAGGSVWIRRMWAPHEIPLSRLLPLPASEAGGRLNKNHAWPAQTNRHAGGGALESGREPHGWGYGAHAPSRLSFALPKLAKAFQTRFGLDDSVGAGGCVRVRVWTGDAQRPRYESSPLVGSQTIGDSGRIDLTDLADDQRRLTLEVDPAHADRPAGADPLNIRDRLNWLDPLLTLDEEKLWSEVAAARWEWNQPWKDWTLNVAEGGSVEVINLFDHHGPGPDRYELGVRAVDKGFTLSRTVQVTAGQRWLIVSGWVYHVYSDRPKLELRVDGLPVREEFIVPMRPSGHRQPPAMIVSLAPYIGHEIELELVQTPGDDRLPVVWRSIHLTDQIPWLHRLVEDNELPVPIDAAQQGTAELVDADKHTGERALKLTPDGKFHLEFDRPLKISLTPELGEFRYLRFAFRKFGKGRICVELDHADAAENPFRHDAGFGPPCFGKAHRVWTQPLPSEWIVMTRDLCADFPIRSAEVTGLTLSVPDGEYALFDHIYLARNDTDFQQLPLAASPEATNQKAFDALAAALWEQTAPSIARLEIAGRQASGVLVGRGGDLLTAGHVIGGVDREVNVHLADGRKLQARSLGIDRENDLALLRLPEGEYPGLEINASRDLHRTDRYGAMSHTSDPDAPVVTKASNIKVAFRETIWIEQSIPQTLAGGPLLDVEGRLIGIHSRISRLGGQLYTAGWRVSLQREPLRQGKIFGSWVSGAGPTLGIRVTPIREGAKIDSLDLPAGVASPLRPGDIITRVDTHSVVSQADIDNIVQDKDPGETVTVDLLRAGERLTENLPLQYRRP